MKDFFITAADGLKIATAFFDVENPKALVQIIHGSAEHKERYFELCHYPTRHHYAVIICDNRGHGASLNKEYKLGYMDGYKPVLDDLFLVSGHIRNAHPDKELFLIGHSLGSVFARLYLEEHDDEISKLVLSGTVDYNPMTPIGIMLARFIILLKGKHGYCGLLRKVVKNGKDISWVSANEKNLYEYMRDPLCGFPYTNSACLTILESVKELAETTHFKCRNPSLPILSVSGSLDPVTGGRRGLAMSFELLESEGYLDFSNIIYPKMKHEVLNETGKQKVFGDILKFFKQK